MHSKTLNTSNQSCELLIPMVPPTHRQSQHGLGWSPIQSSKWDLEKTWGKTSDCKMCRFPFSKSLIMIKPKWLVFRIKPLLQSYQSSVLVKLIKKNAELQRVDSWWQIQNPQKPHKLFGRQTTSPPWWLKTWIRNVKKGVFQSLSLGNWTADCCSSHNVCLDVSPSIKWFSSIKYSTVQPVWEEYKIFSYNEKKLLGGSEMDWLILNLKMLPTSESASAIWALKEIVQTKWMFVITLISFQTIILHGTPKLKKNLNGVWHKNGVKASKLAYSIFLLCFTKGKYIITKYFGVKYNL